MEEQAQASQGAPVQEGAAGDEGPIPFQVQQPLIEAEDAVQEDDDLQDQEDGAQDTGGLFFFFLNRKKEREWGKGVQTKPPPLSSLSFLSPAQTRQTRG